MGLTMKAVVCRAVGRTARLGWISLLAESSGVRQRGSGQGERRGHGTEFTPIGGAEWGNLSQPLDVMCQIIDDRVSPILCGRCFPLQIGRRAVELGDQPTALDDHGGRAVRLGPVAGGNPVLAPEAVPRDNVLGGAWTEDCEEVFQHVATSHQVGIPSGRVAQPGLRRAEVEDAVRRHPRSSVTARDPLRAGRREEVVSLPVFAGKARVNGGARHRMCVARDGRA